MRRAPRGPESTNRAKIRKYGQSKDIISGNNNYFTILARQKMTFRVQASKQLAKV